MMRTAILLAGLLVLAGGCSTPTVYYWGHYENLIYASYAAPGKIPPEMQVEQLEADYQKARSANKPVPPGFHAYLGYLYSELGKMDQARQEFETEKALFPESAVFMDRLLANLKKS
ncbi:MAG: DUF4810 domain-containing protein [Verrucomicrobiales bacterium]|nr:DUF4810 domain-containing protein [Verrucomicrobiales bacterium]